MNSTQAIVEGSPTETKIVRALDLRDVDLPTHAAKIRSLSFRHPLNAGNKSAIKRLFDIAFSLVIIVGILSWLLPLLSIAVVLDTRSFPIFWQKRHGRNHQVFRCLKFRTMVRNPHSDLLQASRNDARITRLGKSLRTYNIDELPQFINVLFGQMSVVGPRPHMVSQTEYCEQWIPGYEDRLVVKPGVTGLAQCRGSHGPTPRLSDMKRRVDYDRFYIRHWSFGLDLRIIWETTKNAIRLAK